MTGIKQHVILMGKRTSQSIDLVGSIDEAREAAEAHLDRNPAGWARRAAN